jgi:hypothetical protein
MTWAKVDDGFWCHPKVVGLPLEAIGVWALALSWCSKNLTDGAIPRRLVKAMEWPETAVDELVAEGLWEETDRGWLVHDYLDFNPSKSDVDAAKDSQRKRTAKFRDRRKRKDVSHSNAFCNGVGNAPPDPVKSTTTTASSIGGGRTFSHEELRGFNWFAELFAGGDTSSIAPLVSFRSAYGYIGARCLAEGAVVARNIRGTTWCQQNRHRVGPAHVQKYWLEFLVGNRNHEPAQPGRVERQPEYMAPYVHDLAEGAR